MTVDPRPGTATRVDADNIEGLVEAIFDPLRALPLVVISAASDTDRSRLSPASVVRAVGDEAAVAYLAGAELAYKLKDGVGDLTVFGGAVRVYAPAASECDSWSRHPVVTVFPGDDEQAKGHEIARVARRLAPSHRAQSEPVPDTDVHADCRHQQHSSERRLEATQRQVTKLQEQVAQAQKEAREATWEPPRVFADEAQQLRWEVELAWLMLVDEQDRGNLPPWELGRDFVASLEQHIVPRRKVVEVMVDVLTGQASFRRGLHPWLDGRGGVQRVRATDGAQGWRAYVKEGASGAPRLTYWQRTDGVIEFHHVGHHDALL